MEFVAVDTLSAYEILLAAPDTRAREEVFLRELVEPFQGVVNLFDGDGIRAFASWNMSPEQFAGENKLQMRTMLDTLRNADAPGRALRSLEMGRAAFEQYVNPLPLIESFSVSISPI